MGRAAIASGASTGIYEALELRDNDPKFYNGQGVLNAVANVNEKIAQLLVGQEDLSQEDVDNKMIALDGTDNKSNLGANAILGVSLAVCKAAAKAKNIPLYKYINEISKTKEKPKLPVPMFNVLNGGMHSDSGLSIQEFKLFRQELKNSESN